MQDNLYGKIFWYFANIFNKKELHFIHVDIYLDSKQRELEVTKKYCEFCEIVK